MRRDTIRDFIGLAIALIVTSVPAAAAPSPEGTAFIPPPAPPRASLFFHVAEGILQLSSDQRSVLVASMHDAHEAGRRLSEEFLPQSDQIASQFSAAMGSTPTSAIDPDLIERLFAERQTTIERIVAEYETRLWDFARTSLMDTQAEGIPAVLSMIRCLVYTNATTPRLPQARVEPVSFVFSRFGADAATMAPDLARTLAFVLNASRESIDDSVRSMHTASWQLQLAYLRARIDAIEADVDIRPAVRRAYELAYPRISGYGENVERLVADLTGLLPADQRQEVEDDWIRLTTPAAFAGRAGLETLLADVSAAGASDEGVLRSARATELQIRERFSHMVSSESEIIGLYARQGMASGPVRLSYVTKMLDLRRQRAAAVMDFSEVAQHSDDPNIVESASKLHRAASEELELIRLWEEDVSRGKAPEWPRS
jgi:hypothetical protein